MKTGDKGDGAVKTTRTAFQILETLQRFDGARISEMSQSLGMAKSTIHRHLSTLHEMNYVVKEGDEYFPGTKFLKIGEYTRTRKEAYRMAKPKVRKLAQETGERAQFVVEEHGKARVLYRETGDQAVHVDAGIGKTFPIHASAAGKVLLTYLPQKRTKDIIDQHDLPSMTAYTITETEELFEELETIREKGYAFNKQESIEGLHAVGVPVLGPDNQIVGAFSISGPTHRLKGDLFEQDLPDLLLGTANEVELNITYS